MRSWKYTLLALTFGVPLQAFAFLGMNAAATLQGPLPAWTKQIGSKGNPKASSGNSTAADSSGNVYVAGDTNGGFDGNTLTGTNDYFLAKYDSTGAKLWTIQRGIASKTLTASGVATDPSGNVIMTGNTNAGLDGNTLMGTQDFFVVKYDSTGARLWTKELGVSSNSTNSNAITTDSSGNIFVTGSTTGGLDGNTISGTSNYDLFVTKYDSSGTKLWTKQVGPGSSFSSLIANSVATDSSGNVIVGGFTLNHVAGQTRLGNTDSFLIKYDSAGNKLWTIEFGVPGGAASVETYSVATDSSGNVYAAGWTDTGMDGNTQTGDQDLFVTKYNSSGVRQSTWQTGAASADIYVRGVTLDSSGNVDVTGYTDAGLDGNTLTGSYDFYVTQFNSSGVKQWTKQLGAPGSSAFSLGISKDPSGNVFVTGRTFGDFDGNTLTGDPDIFLTKYSSSGSKFWTIQKGSVTGTSGTISNASVTTDSAGNVYVTGATDSGLEGNTQTGTTDAFVTKYNSAGIRLWTQQLGVSSQDTWPNGITLDSAGNVLVAGYTTGGFDGNTLTGDEDFFVTKFDSTGTKLWTNQLGVASESTDANAVATDISGNIFVAGNTTGGLDGNTLSGAGNGDFFVTKYDASGTKLWTRQMGPSGTSHMAQGYNVATDSSGNVIVIGTTDASIDGHLKVGFVDSFIVKYDSTGAKLWSVEFGSSTYAYAYGLTTDASGNILIAGSVKGNFDGNIGVGSYDLFVTEYDPTGNRQWTKQMGTIGKATEAEAVRIDSFGNIYAAGDTNGGLDGNPSTGALSYFVTKYTSAGVKQWTKQMGSASNNVFGYGVAISPLGQLYVSGVTSGGLDNNALIGTQDGYLVQYIGN